MTFFEFWAVAGFFIFATSFAIWFAHNPAKAKDILKRIFSRPQS